MAIITITTPFNIDLEFKLATFLKRVLAWTIDIFVICIYFVAILKGLFPLLHLDSVTISVVEGVILIVPVMIYQLSFEIFFNGQTIGKKLVGIKIIDKDGNEPSWGQYLLRWLLGFGNYFTYIIPFFILVQPAAIFGFMIVYIPDVVVLLISAKSQRIGDLAAGTVVIDANYKPNINETIYQEIEVMDYTPLFPQVMRLTDRDINGIRNLIEVQKKSKENDTYMLQVVYKLKSVLNIESELSGYDFLQQLLYDYNYLAGKN